jgi:hypothetical protein
MTASSIVRQRAEVWLLVTGGGQVKQSLSEFLQADSAWGKPAQPSRLEGWAGPWAQGIPHLRFYATGVQQKIRPDTCSCFADRKSDCVLRGVINVTILNCNITSHQTYRTVVMRAMRCMF